MDAPNPSPEAFSVKIPHPDSTARAGAGSIPVYQHPSANARVVKFIAPVVNGPRIGSGRGGLVDRDAEIKPERMQRAGEVCQSCLPHWQKMGEETGQLLVRLPKTTEKGHIIVIVCPFCDGSSYRYAKTNARREKEEAEREE